MVISVFARVLENVSVTRWPATPLTGAGAGAEDELFGFPPGANSSRSLTSWIVGASFTPFTVSTKISLAVAVPSLTVRVMVGALVPVGVAPSLAARNLAPAAGFPAPPASSSLQSLSCAAWQFPHMPGCFGSGH